MEKKLNIFEYTDYREFLRDYYELQKRQTRYFSYRYFSNKAGFASHNVLKLVINGERNIAIKSIPKFCKALNLTAKECEYFKLSVMFSQAKNSDEKNAVFKDIIRFRRVSNVTRVNELQYKMYSDWYNSIVRELVEFEDVESDAEGIAGKITPSVTVAQLKKSLKLLEEIGLIEKTSNGKYKQKDAIIKTDEEIESLAVRNYNKQMIEFGKEAIEEINVKDREISSMTLGVSKEMVEKLKTKIRRFKDEILADVVSDSSDSTGVYQLNFQFFPIYRRNDND